MIASPRKKMEIAQPTYDTIFRACSSTLVIFWKREGEGGGREGGRDGRREGEGIGIKITYYSLISSHLVREGARHVDQHSKTGQVSRGAVHLHPVASDLH